MRNVRVFYRKCGRMKFVSHLDMNRFMARLIAKSKIPILYTEGFNQHIYMNFAVPLSLGYEGLYEIMDIRLVDDNFKNEDCLNALKSVCPPDIEFLDVTDPEMPMKDIAFAEYILKFEEFGEQLAAALKKFLGSKSLICEKTGKKGRVKEIDLIPKIKSYEILSDGVKFVLAAGSNDNLNPSFLMSVFFEKSGITPSFFTVTRTMLYTSEGRQFR